MKFYLTTAIVYSSQKPHIGNSYEIILSDAISRYKKMQGHDVLFMTGTDEHGQKIEKLAEKDGVSPKEVVDKVTEGIKEIYKKLNISYDRFIRTTDEYHKDAVKKVFNKLYEKGDIYKNSYEGLYCTPCESFWTKTQAEDGNCPDCGRPVNVQKEEAYFFRLSKYQKQIESLLENNPGFIYPESKKKEMLNNFIKPGLQDLCVSRTSVKWGIPVDFDNKHIIYVWIDALINYCTGIGYNPDGSTEMFEKYWPCDVHIIGKDILRFHSIYWPALLMALEIPLPKHIFAHPWLLFGEDKMSKSKGNVMYADELADLFGVDAIRYYVLAEMPYNADGTITYESIAERYNSDLANTLGNLVNRTISMNQKYFEGKVQSKDFSADLDEEIIKMALETVKEVETCVLQYRIADSLDAVMSYARRLNKYIDETTPWILAKNEEDLPRLGTVLYNLLEGIRFLGILLTPFMPSTGSKILHQLNCNISSYESLSSFGSLEVGSTLGTPSPLFNRLDKDFLANLNK